MGAVTGLVIGLLLGVQLGGVVATYALLFGVLGFVGGGVFSTVLRIAEGDRRFDELSLPRFALWGAIGGGALGLLTVLLRVVGLGVTPLAIAVVGTAGLLGAASAAGSLLLARRAEDQELLTAGHQSEEVGLTQAENRELLGGAS